MKPEQYQQESNNSYKKHVTTKLRSAYPSIADADDDELIQVWHKLNIPDADSTEAEEVLRSVYGTDWVPPEMPAPTLGERAQGLGEAAKSIGGALKDGLVSGFNAPIRAVKELGEGQRIEKIAGDMPAPDIAALRARGYNEQQIRNVVTGYTDTQNSLMGDLEASGREGIQATAEGAANYATLPLTLGKTAAIAGKAATGFAAKAGAKNLLASAAGGAVQHGTEGAALGAVTLGAQEAVARGEQARADGKKANEILSAYTGGMWEGGKTGLAAGAIIGGTIGAVAGPIAAKVGAAKTQSAARKAAAAKSVADAKAVMLRNSGENFQAAWLHERFPDELKLANEQGLPDEILAQNIFVGIHGPEDAQSESGMRAISEIYRKITNWRKANEGLRGTMLDLPAIPGGAATTLGGIPNDAAQALTPNMAQPMGAGLDAQGGFAPEPNVPAGLQGPVGTQTAPFMPPQNVPQVPGLEAMPQPTQAEVPMNMAPVAPDGPLSPRVLPELAQPLPVEQLAPQAAPEINPVDLGPVDVTPRYEPNELITRNFPEPKVDVPDPSLRELPTVADDAVASLAPSKTVDVAVGEGGRSLRLNKIVGEPGKSVDALSSLHAEADKRGLPVDTVLENVPGPKGGKIPLNKLIPWYEGQGYKVVTNDNKSVTMRREPKGPVAVRQNLPPALQRDVVEAIEQNVSPVVENLTAAPTPPAPGRWHQTDLFADTQIVAAKQRMKKRGIRLNAMVDPADLADVAIIGANYMLKGAAKFADWSEHMVKEFGEGVRPHLNKIYQDALALYQTRRPTGNDEVRQIGLKYITEMGFGAGRAGEYHPLNTELSQKIAKMYDEMPVKPKNKADLLAAKNSYKAFVDEVERQYKMVEDEGIKFEFTDEDPYPNSAEMMKDVRENKRLRVNKTPEGSFHPYLTSQQNDKFRAVHDFFGHSAEGFEFGARGEDNAWRKHVAMFSNKAIPAMTTETRGQNSWVNFMPGHDKLPPKERPFAAQKFGLLPKEAYSEVLVARQSRPRPGLSVGLVKQGSGGTEEAAARLSKGVREAKSLATEQSRAIADAIEGVPAHLKTMPESAEWYANSIAETEALTFKEYPSMEGNPAKMTLFKLLLAITSPQTNVPQNYAAASKVWDGFEKTGKFPMYGRQGQEINIISRSFIPRVNALLKKYDGDFDGLAAFLTDKDAKGKHNAVRIFGPKVGRFFLNLTGETSETTVDIWMGRWYRRVNGKLFEKKESGGKVLREDKVLKSEGTSIRDIVKDIAETLGTNEAAVQASLWDREKKIWSSAGLQSDTIDFAQAARAVIAARNASVEKVGANLSPTPVRKTRKK